jgi:hypothetical protein
MRILGFSILYSGYALSALDQANLLSLTFTSFSYVLQFLYSIIDAPTSHGPSEKPIRSIASAQMKACTLRCGNSILSLAGEP